MASQANRRLLRQRREWVWISALCLLLVTQVAVPSGAEEPGSTAPGTALPPELAELVAAHNRERATEKLPPLKPNAKLSAAALAHSRDMAEHEMMSHEGSDGSKFYERINREGYNGRKLAENVAAGQNTVDEVMREWMNSPHHRVNILGQFSDIGVAYGTSDKGIRYWTTTFGQPRERLEPAEAAAGLVEAVNKARAEAEKPPLKMNPKLSQAAQGVAQSLASLGDLQQGQNTYAERARQAGYRYRLLGEAAASGQPTPADVLQDWLKQDVHRDNLLGKFTDVGAGYALNDKGIPFWMIFLGQPQR